jgi:hypothetical protein
MQQEVKVSVRLVLVRLVLVHQVLRLALVRAANQPVLTPANHRDRHHQAPAVLSASLREAVCHLQVFRRAVFLQVLQLRRVRLARLARLASVHFHPARLAPACRVLVVNHKAVWDRLVRLPQVRHRLAVCHLQVFRRAVFLQVAVHQTALLSHRLLLMMWLVLPWLILML